VAPIIERIDSGCASNLMRVLIRLTARMPGGSPGMGNDPTARYDVIAFGGDAGDGEVFYQAGL
jgi:hypothetical protein